MICESALLSQLILASSSICDWLGRKWYQTDRGCYQNKKLASHFNVTPENVTCIFTPFVVFCIRNQVIIIIWN